MILAEQLAQQRGLFHNPIERVQAYRNKYLMRSAFAACGVEQPAILAKFDGLDQVDAFDWSSIEFPVIVKPVDLTGSLHVRLCHDAVGARRVLLRIFKHAKSFSGQSFVGQALVEEPVFGPEYSAECVVREGELLHLVPTTKFVSPYPACDEVGHLSGEPLKPAIAAQIELAVSGIVRAWNLRSAVLHVEFKISGGRLKVIEAACRIGGDMISELVGLRHGVSLEECLVLLRAGKDPAPALRAREPATPAVYYGIKYLFAENQATRAPADVDVLRLVRSSTAEHLTGGGYGLERRLGHALVRSTNLGALKTFLEERASTSACHTTFDETWQPSHQPGGARPTSAANVSGYHIERVEAVSQ